MDVSTLKARVNALLTESKQDSESPHDTSYLLQGALTVMSAAYGTESRQVTALLESTKIMHNTSVMLHVRHREAFKAIRGALENLKGELDAGLAGSLQKRMAGEVLVDFIQQSERSIIR